MAREYEVHWITGMGRGLASHLQTVANGNAERGWVVDHVVVDDAGEQHGAFVILGRERPDRKSGS